MVGLEHPARWGGLIDLPSSVDWLGRSSDRVARDFAAVLSGGLNEDQVAIREQSLFAPRLVRTPRAETGRAPWQPTGTVLVAGGTGVVGARVARWLVGRGAGHVVLVSRRGWEAPGAGELAADLAAAGARVSVESCDVTDRAALAGLLARLASEGTPVCTAFHCAATIDLRPLAETSVDQLTEIVATKALGAQNLDALLADGAELVLFSSITGVCGSGEHGAYAAANAHLDAFAEQRRAAGKPTTSIAWGVWDADNPHDDPALTGRRRELNQRAGARGLPLMDPGLGVAALGCVLDEDDGVCVVADVEWGRFTALFGSVRESRLFVEIAGAAGSESVGSSGAAMGGVRDRLSGLSGAERERVLVELVCGHSAAALGHSAAGVVDAGRAFKELGFDSLIAVELRNRLSQATGLSLPPTLVFDYPTPAAVAGYLAGQLDESAAVTAATIRGQVKAVEDAVAAAALSEDEQHGIAALLEDLLERWRAAGEHGGSALADDALDEASDDELFEFIHSEFGRPALG